MTKKDREFIAKSIYSAAGAILAAMPGLSNEDGIELVQILAKQIIEVMHAANEADEQ